MFLFYPIPYVGLTFAVIAALVNFIVLTQGNFIVFFSNVFLAIIAGVLVDIFYLLYKRL